MRKLICITLLFALLLAFLAACDNGEAEIRYMAPPPSLTDDEATASALSTDTTGDNSEDQPYSHWQGLRMYVPDGSVTPTGLRLSMINSSSQQDFGHGVMFSLQQYASGQWAPVPFATDSVAWILPLLSIAPNTTVDENITWEWIYGQLPPGRYRIVRNFMGLDWDDLRPMWEQDIADAYLYTTFTVAEDNQAAADEWQTQQEHLAAIAYARFDGLDLEIQEYSPRGLTFTLANNNPYYSYELNGIFVGWEDSFPGGGSGGAVEYFIFSRWGFRDGDSWPFDDNKTLHPGEYFTLEVDWYGQIGNLTSSMSRSPLTPYVFDLVVDVTLDVDEEYINANFRHFIPGLPNVGHRIKAHFDISP